MLAIETLSGQLIDQLIRDQPLTMMSSNRNSASDTLKSPWSTIAWKGETAPRFKEEEKLDLRGQQATSTAPPLTHFASTNTYALDLQLALQQILDRPSVRSESSTTVNTRDPLEASDVDHPERHAFALDRFVPIVAMTRCSHRRCWQ